MSAAAAESGSAGVPLARSGAAQRGEAVIAASEVPADGVIVAGGGIAGIAAALKLAEAGVAVTLLETRKKLGGRATSFVDARTGERIDNCQHVALRCCTHYLDLLARLGADQHIRWDAEQYWVERGGRTSVIRPGLFPAPGHFTGSVLAAKFLSWGEVAQLGRAMAAIMRADRAAWRTRTFGEFLRSAGQSARVIDRFWQPVVVSACNLPVDRAAASSALHVFQEGFLAHRDAATMGVATVPLVDLYDRAEAVIASRGGRVVLGASVERLDAERVWLSGGVELRARRVVCAVPAERVLKVVEPSLIAGDPRFEAIAAVEHSPILGVHLVFDRPVLPTKHAVLVEGGTQWLFRKDDAGAKLHAVISAADEWMELTEEQIAQRVVEDVRAYFPAASDARLIAARSVKEKRATFAATPAWEARRPGVTGPSGVILAGDYTDTGWPATMEGATRSGYFAAAAVLGKSASSALLPGLPVRALPRMLGLGATA